MQRVDSSTLETLLPQLLTHTHADSVVLSEAMETLKGMDSIAPFLSWSAWKQLSGGGRRVVSEALAFRINQSFGGLSAIELVGLKSYPNSPTATLPLFRDAKTDVYYALVPSGGSFFMGINDSVHEKLYTLIWQEFMRWRRSDEVEGDGRDELVHAEDGITLKELSNGNMRALSTPSCIAKPFLIAIHPLTVHQLETMGFDEDRLNVLSGYDPNEDHLGNNVWLKPQQVRHVLDSFGYLRLPSETEWEYAARVGRDCVCPFVSEDNDRLPNETDLVWCYKDVENSTHNKNGLGLMGMGGMPEVCSDVYQPTYEGDFPLDGSPRLSVDPAFNACERDGVVKGGAIGCSPWQGCGEWGILLPYYRYKTPYSLGLGLRPVIDIR